MTTSALLAPNSARQLSFVWQDSTTATVGNPSKTARRTNRKRKGLDLPPVANRPNLGTIHDLSDQTISNSALTNRTQRPASSSSERSGQPQHIGGLMQAVLARYGIDPSEFMSQLESE